LLGGFDLRYHNEALNTINTTRLQSLLVYLLLYKDAPVSRQHLAFLFWPDSSEAQARTNLRNLLHKLRSLLPDADRYLDIQHHTVQWRSSSHFLLDVDQFVSFASQAKSSQELKQAVQIYAGDFMPGCYEDWAQSIRENLRQTYLFTLEKLLFLLANDHGQREALEYAHILLRQDPTREETYRHLMHLYAQSGDRASVARVYKTCVTVLERELGIEPGTMTQKAYKDALDRAADSNLAVQAPESHLEEHLHHNLPVSLTSFVGRVRELEQIKSLLFESRLVTLSGPGGMGKTRLALAAARELLPNYRDGIFLVDLAPIDHPEMVTTTIADALQANDDIRDAGLDGLINLLRDQSLLLLLDNCEHLNQEAGRLSLALLQACPELRILTTSRETLNIYGERIWQVPALPTPGRTERTDPMDLTNQAVALETNESVKLFIERAVSTLPTFRVTSAILPAIAEICRHLEGIPLAIEMAAARVKTLTVHQIVQRLDNILELLKGSSNAVLPRHHTMEAVMDWSYDMLTIAERELFARLSIFSGHFSLEAVESICAGKGIAEREVLELLASLVDKSLVGMLPMVHEARFRLHEIARQYARRKLETQGKPIHWQNLHLDYFVRFAEEAEPELRGAGQLEWLRRLDLEQENLRAALHLALEENISSNNHRVDSAARLAGALWIYWFIRGHFSEGRHWAEQVLALLDQTGTWSGALGKVLYTAASFCCFQGDFLRAQVLTRRSMVVSKENGDAFGQVISYHHFGMIANAQGDKKQASRHYQRGLKIATRAGDPWLIGVMQSGLGGIALDSNDQENALKYYGESMELARRFGDKFQIFYNITDLAALALQRGDIAQAAMLAEEGLTLSRLLGERRGIAFSLQQLGRIALAQKEYDRAGELLKQSLQILWGTRDRATVIEYIVQLANYEMQEQRFEVAARLLAACEAALTTFPAGYRLPCQSLYEQMFLDLETLLDPGVFTAARTLGRLMSLEQAVSFALIDHRADADRYTRT
jgi:predicted ATPase/DNA-binding SARP family transcriptional activator